MTGLYRLADADEDLPDDGLLAVEMRNPDEKPRIRLVPVTIDHEAANAKMRGLMPDDYEMTTWTDEPWPAAFVELIVAAAVQ